MTSAGVGTFTSDRALLVFNGCLTLEHGPPLSVMREPGVSDLVAVAPVVAVLVSICLLGPYEVVP